MYTRQQTFPNSVAMSVSATMLCWLWVMLPMALGFIQAPPQHRASVARNIWYASGDIDRDRTRVLDPTDAKEVLVAGSSRFIVMQRNRGMLHHAVQDHTEDCRPLFLNLDEINALVGRPVEDVLDSMSESSDLLAWVGQFQDVDYWVVRLSDESSILGSPAAGTMMAPLREFGDRLSSSTDAAILATANGLVEFHDSHPYCSKCASPTISARAGACRKCAGCKTSHYPRIDVASIMLITCGNYALLGRKANWPKGRYSTLAGFAEVGETLEECCVRETLEESGVQADLSSVQFVASQPWPFPRSLMVGFTATAIKPHDTGLPPILINKDEMDDIQWFSRDYVAARLEGGSTALGFQPNQAEQDFHIPGKASLARLLITQWAMER